MEIIYENKDILVLNKPAGTVVHSGVKTGKTIVDWLLKMRPTIKGIGDSQRPGIVHRLDKNTSGVLLVAKTNPMYNFLKKQFKQRLVQKTYLALVYGQMEKETGKINLPIGRSPKNRIKQTTKPTINSRPALTEFKLIKRFSNFSKVKDGFSLIEVKPFTGRTHQIRVHLAAINHPLVGDRLYITKPYRPAVDIFKRPWLHAWKIKISLPQNKEKEFEAPLPADLKQFLASLEQK